LLLLLVPFQLLCRPAEIRLDYDVIATVHGFRQVVSSSHQFAEKVLQLGPELADATFEWL
jgi:hypothetical protein